MTINPDSIPISYGSSNEHYLPVEYYILLQISTTVNLHYNLILQHEKINCNEFRNAENLISIGLEFVRINFAECIILNRGSFEPNLDS